MRCVHIQLGIVLPIPARRGGSLYRYITIKDEIGNNTSNLQSFDFFPKKEKKYSKLWPYRINQRINTTRKLAGSATFRSPPLPGVQLIHQDLDSTKFCQMFMAFLGLNTCSRSAKSLRFFGGRNQVTQMSMDQWIMVNPFAELKQRRTTKLPTDQEKPRNNCKLL